MSDVELTEEDIAFIKDLRESHQEGQISRRQAVALLASGVGIGGLGGGLAVQSTRADASTGDNDGNVGLPNDRVDVYADGVDATSVDTDQLSGADIANAANGEVPKSDGAGNLSMGSVGGGGMMSEDGNSPFTASSVQTKQFTLASSWDRVAIIPQADNDGHNQLQVNGDTGSNYDYVDLGTTESTGNSQWDLGIPISRCDSIILKGDAATGVIRAIFNVADALSSMHIAGVNSNVSPPIDTITLTDSNFASTQTIEVWGMNVG